MYVTKLSAAGVIVGSLLVNAGSLPANAETINGSTYRCGPATCSFYIARGTTKKVYEAIRPAINSGSTTAIIGAAGAACIPLGPVSVVVCTSAATVYGTSFTNSVRAAAQQDACLKVRHTIPGGPVVQISVDNSRKDCRN